MLTLSKGCLHVLLLNRLLIVFSEFISQNLLWVGAFVVVANLWVWSLLQTRISGAKLVSALALPALQRGGKSLIVDLSDEASFSKAHIPGAINVLLGDVNEENKTLKKHRNSTIILVCKNGGVSNKAVRTLRQLGFEDLHVLNGGMMSWTKENLPIEKNDHT